MSRSRLAASGLALLTAISVWLSLGTVAVLSGDTHRIAAFPSLWILFVLLAAGIGAATVAKPRLEQSWPLVLTLLLWLPFVPGRIPATFLIWQGPIEAFVWLIAVAGVIAARPPQVLSVVSDPARAPWLAGAAVAVVSLIVFSGVRGVVPNGDEPHYLAATQSILKDFDLRVANNYTNGDYLDYFAGRLEPHFLKRSTSGEIYSIHAPGVSVVLLPAFAIAGYTGAVVMMCLIAALTAAIAWRLAWRVSASVVGAWVGVAAVFATTPYFFHTFTIYPEVIGGLCVACGAWLWLDLADQRDVSPRLLLGASGALALLPWLHSRFAVIAGALGLVVVTRLAERRAFGRIGAFLAIPAIAGAAWFTFFWLIWGSPSPAAPYGADTSTSSSFIVPGLLGLLVDQQFGLVTTSPIYLIAMAGIIWLARHRPRLTAELLLIVVPYAIAVASYAMWWAGTAAPARFLVALLPLAALPIAALVSARPKAVPLMLLLVSAGLLLPRALVENGRFIYTSRGSGDVLLQWLSPAIDLAVALPSVHRDGGLLAARDATIWVAMFVITSGAAARLARRWPARAWAVHSSALGLVVMMSVGLVAGIREAALVSSERSKLFATGSFRPGWHTVVAELSPAGPNTAADFLSALSLDVSMAVKRFNRVPAGEYQVSVVAPAPQRGTVAMFLGRNDRPIESPALDDLRNGRSGFTLRLPVAVSTLNLTAPAEVGAGNSWLTLRPLRVVPPANSRYAIRAARYGHARAFFFDEQAYPEEDGFWTRANGTATVVIDSDDAARRAGLPISITAGAEPTRIELTVGAWDERFELAAGQRHDVMLPPATGQTWLLSIRSGPGFRPFEREPGSNDVRTLAAWVTVN